MFKEKYTFDLRRAQAQRVLASHPHRVPLICERVGTNVPTLDKHKYLEPRELLMSQFVYILRQRMKLDASQAIFAFIDGTIAPGSKMVGEVYQDHHDSDGFLYISYSGENTFGGNKI